MRKSLLLAAVIGTFAATNVAFAEEAAPAAPESPHSFSYNIGLHSQYIWRGMTQTDEKPALQGGMDYEHASGFYAGVWASNVSWLTDTNVYDSGGSLEIDLYAGFAGEFGETGIGYDVGVLQYLYPGNRTSGKPKADATELYAGLSYGWLSGKYSYLVSDEGWAFSDARGTWYAELNADIPVADTGFTVNLHIGRFEFDGSPAGASNSAYDYTDWKAGLTKSWDNGVDVGAYYTKNNASDAAWGTAYPWTDSQTVFFVSKSF